jgi:hypothetical protein
MLSAHVQSALWTEHYFGSEVKVMKLMAQVVCMGGMVSYH